MVAAEKARYEERGQSAQTGIRLFLEYEDQFSNWLGKIEDAAWINETAHVCKQLEEYGEEIRDVAWSPELSFSYIEHCMPSFVTYCEWFEQLPWDNPSRDMTLVGLLAGIERDLKIAHREIENLKIKDADRFAKRCLQQVRKNILNVNNRIESQTAEYKNQRKMCNQLTRSIDHLSELLTYAIIASWDIQQTHEVDADEAFRRVLRKEFGGTESFDDYFLDQIEQSLKLCKELSEKIESEQ
jgi:hypothetical protein